MNQVSYTLAVVLMTGLPKAAWGKVLMADVSDRFAHRGPGAPRLVANPAITDPETRIRTQGERDGWSVNVTRRILRGGIQLVEEQEWLVTYLPQFAVFEVHPCMVSGEPVECPMPTTTTVAPSSTTSSSTP